MIQSIDRFCSSQNYLFQIELFITSNCLGVISKLKRKSTVVSMSTKMNPKVKEFLSSKKKLLSFLEFIKFEAHQDDIKSFDQLILFE